MTRKVLFVSSIVIANAITCNAFFFSSGAERDITKFQPVALSKAQIMPTEKELDGIPAKVFISSFVSTTQNQNGQNDVAEITTKITNALHDGRGAEISNSPTDADYIISGAISTTNGSKFTAGSTQCNKNGKCWEYPPQCTYLSNASGSLQIKSVMNGNIKTVRLSGYKSSSQDTRSSNCGVDINMPSGAIQDAVNNASDMKNMFTKKSFVTEKMVSPDNKEALFLVQSGSDDGMKQNKDVKFFTLESNTNPLTGKTTISEVFTCKGTVTNNIKPKTAWIVIEDTCKDKISLGDFARIIN